MFENLWLEATLNNSVIIVLSRNRIQQHLVTIIIYWCVIFNKGTVFSAWISIKMLPNLSEIRAQISSGFSSDGRLLAQCETQLARWPL